jgi:fructose-1,6-bisphosphatase class II
MELKHIINDLISTSEDAALASSKWIGRNDEKSADRAAVESMRQSFNQINFKAQIVIGEGERDKAPMLHIGEVVGSDKLSPVQFDIAVDPLECTTKCAHNIGGAMSSIVVAKTGMLLPAPDVYMSKIASLYDVINLDMSVEDNLQALSEIKKCDISDLEVTILDRQRHKNIISNVLKCGAKIKLISDGDIAGAIMTCLTGGSDMYIGIGGAPEGVIAAAAIAMLGGHMEGRLLFENESQEKRAASMLKQDLNNKYDVNKLINFNSVSDSGEILFISTGVTSGEFIEGVKVNDGKIITNTVCIYRDATGNVFNRKINTIRNEKKYFDM